MCIWPRTIATNRNTYHILLVHYFVGIQFFSAIFDSEDPTGMSLTLQERRNTVSGFAMGLFSIPLLVDKAFIAEVTRDYSIFVYIELPDGSPKLAHVILPGGRSVNVYVSNEIFGIPLPERDLSKHSFTRQVNVLDQTWELVFVKDAYDSKQSQKKKKKRKK